MFDIRGNLEESRPYRKAELVKNAIGLGLPPKVWLCYNRPLSA